MRPASVKTVCKPLILLQQSQQHFGQKNHQRQEPRRLEGTRKSPRNSTKKVVAFNSFIVVTFDCRIYTVSEVSCSHTTKNIKVGQQSCYRHSDCSNSNLWFNAFATEKAVARTAPDVASIREAPPKVPTPRLSIEENSDK